MTEPPPIDSPRHIIALDRLWLLSVGYYISGAIGAVLVSFLLFHFFILLGFSFIPPSQWASLAPTPSPAQYATASPTPGTPPTSNAVQGPPAVVFRIIAGVLALIIIGGWTLGGLTMYAGYCIKKRKRKLFIYIMAAINCIWIPYGTLLGIATILLFQWPEVREEFASSVMNRL